MALIELGNNRRYLRVFALAIAVIFYFGAEHSFAAKQIETQARVVKVVTSGGFATAYNLLEPLFEESFGIDLQTAYGSSSGGASDSIPERLKRGEQFDVVILSQKSLNYLTEQGEVKLGSGVDLVRSKIGMAVLAGAPKPDISTPDTFVKTLLEADSIGYSASASGTYLSTKLWKEIGIWTQIKHKSKRILSERVATVVARGEVQVGFQQISEILPIDGVDYAGPIPNEFQKITVFSGGILKSAKNSQDAKRLLDYLSSSAATDIISKSGLEPIHH